MSISILHISDLHIEEFNSEDKLIKSRFDEPNFKSKFIERVKRNGKKIDYILITGDLANTGTKEEYDKVLIFINDLSNELSVDKENFFICPGNHDINWRENKIAFSQLVTSDLRNGKPEPKESEAYRFHTEKFLYFTKFYNSFYGKNVSFDPVKAIFRDLTLNINNIEVSLLLINSCYKESFSKDSHFGHIDFESISSQLSDKVKLKIAIFHHIPITFNGTNFIQNWDKEIKYLCNQYKIKVFLFGHQHVSHTSSITAEKEEYFQLSVGSLGKNEAGIDNSFNILTLSVTKGSKKLIITKDPYQYFQHSGSNHWHHLPDNIETLKVNFGRELMKGKDNPKPLITELSPIEYKFPEKIEAFSMKILNTVKEMKLFTSGHFHWNESTRTLGLIDTYTLLSKRRSSILAKGALLELYNANGVNSDFIIGLGQEGNILGAFLACNLGLPYSFIPYHNRKLDYNIHEKDLSIKNSKNLTIVTDVICTARSVLSILNERKELFSKIRTINLFSLFYISNETRYNPQLFESKDKRLKFYTVCDKITIEKCKFSDKDYASCSIYCNQLEKVYNF